MRARTNTRYIPQNSNEVNHPQGLGVAYTYEMPNRFCVVAYTGKACNHSFHEAYRTAEERDNRVSGYMRNLSKWAENKAKRAADRKKPHGLNIGDILKDVWGYEQTNIDFYQVTQVHGADILMRKIGSKFVDAAGPMCGHVKAVKDAFIEQEPEIRRRPTRNGNYVSVRTKNGFASPWDGNKQYVSWYA